MELVYFRVKHVFSLEDGPITDDNEFDFPPSFSNSLLDGKSPGAAKDSIHLDLEDGEVMRMKLTLMSFRSPAADEFELPPTSSF